MNQLRSVLDDITPKLDFALAEGPISDHQHMGPFYELPRDLKRRGGICNATSWLLKEELLNHDIRTLPHSIMGTLNIGDKEYWSYHVLLKAQAGDGRYIDPTYQQFYRHVGLSPEEAHQNPELMDLYPDNDIAIIDPRTTEFQENYAENTHRIERELAKRGLAQGILAGTTLDEKVGVFKQVWDMNAYRSMFSPNRDLQRAVAQSAMLMDRLTLL